MITSLRKALYAQSTPPNLWVEIVLSILTYNIKRAIKILGVQSMIEALA